MTQALGELVEVMGPSATTADLTTEAISLWKAAMCPLRAYGTTVGLLSYLRAACSYAADEGWMDRVPRWKRLRPKRIMPPAIGPHLSLIESAALLGHLASRSRSGEWACRRLESAAAIALYCGLRRDELLFLRIRDVDLEAGIISIVPVDARDLKTAASAQPVGIPPELSPILRSFIPDTGPDWMHPGLKRESAWHGGRPGHRPVDDLRRAAAAAGIPHADWQTLRRTWATHAEQRWGLTDPQIQRVLRHTSPLTSRLHYRAADVANLRDIASRVSYRP
jgi:integrase